MAALTAQIKKTCFHSAVYEPSDDSFLLADAAVAEITSREQPGLQRTPTAIVLEVGAGTGFVLTSAALAIERAGATAALFATDINADAASAAAATLKNHGFQGEVVLTDLFDSLEARLAGRVDLLLFNPPYVPSPPEEMGSRGLPAAWAGGARGREVTDRFVPKVKGALAPGGVCLLIAIAQNDVADLRGALEAHGLATGIAMRRGADEEDLCVVRCTHAGALQ